MIKRLLFLLAALLVWGNSVCNAAERYLGEWLVVTPPDFRGDLAPLIKHRREEGFEVVVLETTKVLTPEQIRSRDAAPLQARIGELFQHAKGPKYLLLAGDATAADPSKAEPSVVPSLTGTIERMKGKPSDHAYGFQDDKGVEMVAIGRLPARTSEELRLMVRKTLELEETRDVDPWRTRITLVAGDPGGGAIAGAMVEQITMPRLTRLHPAWSIHAIFNTSASRYYVSEAQVHDEIVRTIEAGELFTVYMGHSTSDSIWLTGNTYLTRDDWRRVNVKGGRGVFFTCGCFACRGGEAHGEAYGLAALRNPGGPAAVIGPTGESWAAMGQLAMDGLVGRFSATPFPARLGDYWLAVQAGLGRGPMDDFTFKMYDQFDGTQGKTPLEIQRREHLEMWTLLGDPALRLPIVPMDVTIDRWEPVSAGKSIAVSGHLPKRLSGAAVRVSLERPMGSKADGMENLPDNSPTNHVAREQAAMRNNERANRMVLANAKMRAAGNKFNCTLAAPERLPWTNLVLRVYAVKESEIGQVVISVPAGQGTDPNSVRR